MRPLTIAVAITGSASRKKDNPTLQVLPAEQTESTHAVSGASRAVGWFARGEEHVKRLSRYAGAHRDRL
jgi:uncharacterized protein (DUF849 family)